MATVTSRTAASEFIGSEMGAFAPSREEVTIDDLEVIGTIPENFRGTFYRNGPNPRFEPRHKYHMFDGDGMVHALHFTDDGVNYVNRWIRTDRWNYENQEGRALFAGYMDPLAVDPLVSDWSRAQKNNANTHTVFHHGQLLALSEAGIPYILDPVSLETLGKETYSGQLPTPSFTAHPHTDPITGDWLAISYGFDNKGTDLAAFIIDKNNNLRLNMSIEAPYRGIAHDCMFTKDYLILPLFPLTIDPTRPKRGQSFLLWEPDLGSHLGFLPRNATDPNEVRWVSMDACSVFHFYNAYQEDQNTIIIDAAVADGGPAAVGGPDTEGSHMERWKVDLAAGTVKRTRLQDSSADFPRIDERLQGAYYKTAYAVGNLGQGSGIEMRAVYRYDLETGASTVRKLPDGQFTSEMVFVPASPTAAPDEGYLVGFIHNMGDGYSEFQILDAANITDEPVARVRIPVHIPLGFHANWVSANPGYPQGDF